MSLLCTHCYDLGSGEAQKRGTQLLKQNICWSKLSGLTTKFSMMLNGCSPELTEINRIFPFANLLSHYLMIVTSQSQSHERLHHIILILWIYFNPRWSFDNCFLLTILP